MEPIPPPPNSGEYSNYSDYERFALSLYDDADRLFTLINADSYYEKIYDRRMELELPPNYLDELKPILTNYMIDPADSIDIVIQGNNPYKKDTTGPHRGVLWVNIRHKDLISSYALWLNPNLQSRPINATKDLFRIEDKDLQKGQPYDAQGTLEPLETIFTCELIGIDEQNVLKKIVDYLTQRRS